MSPPDPNFVLSECIPSDVDQMVSVFERAFEGNVMNSYTFPVSQIGPSEMKQWLHKRFLSMIIKPEYRNLKIVDTSTGNIAAWARWHFPYTFSWEEKAEKEREKEERKKRGVLEGGEWPVGANLEVCEMKFGALHRIRHELVDFENAYVVYLIQVDPAYQRKGLGAMLLNHGISLANAEGRKVHLEATPEGYPLYKKLGFKDVEVLTFDLSRWGGKEPGFSTVMVWEPQKGINE